MSSWRAPAPSSPGSPPGRSVSSPPTHGEPQRNGCFIHDVRGLRVTLARSPMGRCPTLVRSQVFHQGEWASLPQMRTPVRQHRKATTEFDRSAVSSASTAGIGTSRGRRSTSRFRSVLKQLARGRATDDAARDVLAVKKFSRACADMRCVQNDYRTRGALRLQRGRPDSIASRRGRRISSSTTP